jgi:molecular chaperone GrpE
VTDEPLERLEDLEDGPGEPVAEAAQPPVRESGPGEGDGGNREVPPAELDPVAEVTRERDEYLDALQRLKAEFDNYRKRVLREQGELSVRANEQLVKQLLPVLDDLERALEAAAEHEEAKLEEGVRLVHRALGEVLARQGLVEVETVGAFDPHTQEALLSQPSDEDEGTIVQVIQKGYKLGDRVLRPARVVVSAGSDAGGEVDG